MSFTRSEGTHYRDPTVLNIRLSICSSYFTGVNNLFSEFRSMNQNELTAVPFLGDASSNITVLSL